MSGKVMHFEIPFDDGDRARGFYGETFGWQMVPVPGMDYTMVMTGPTDEEQGPTEPGFINGGMFERSAEFAGKAPNLVIDVASVDEALRMVDALQFFEQNGEVCPANWQAGEKAMQHTSFPW